MALLADMLGGRLLAAAAVGATALVLPRIAPSMPLPLRSLIKNGVSLFLEAEFEAEGGIIERLAGNVLSNVLQTIPDTGSAAERNEAAQAAIADFKRIARARARRYGHNDRDRSTRYARHMHALKRAIERERPRHKGARHAALADMVAALDTPRPMPTQEGSHGSA